jgi:YihY family inner membrane protein
LGAIRPEATGGNWKIVGSSTRTGSWLARAARHLPQPVRSFTRDLRDDDILLFAAGLGFYALISLIPLVIMVLWLTSLALGDERVQRLADAVKTVAPKNLGADLAVQRIADQGTRLGITSIVLGLWPATSYGAALSRAFDRLASGRSRRIDGLRGRGLLLLVLLPIFVLGGLAAAFLGTRALGTGLLGRVAGPVVGLIAGFLGAAVAIGLIYRVFPERRMTWSQIGIATAVAAAGVSVISLAFVLYLTTGADFAERYATSSVAGIVLLGVWLFLANALVLLGYRFGLER